MKAYACSKGEFQVVRAKSVVVDRDINDFLQKLWFSEEVFCNPEPEAEELQRFLFQKHSGVFFMQRIEA